MSVQFNRSYGEKVQNEVRRYQWAASKKPIGELEIVRLYHFRPDRKTGGTHYKIEVLARIRIHSLIQILTNRSKYELAIVKEINIDPRTHNPQLKIQWVETNTQNDIWVQSLNEVVQY